MAMLTLLLLFVVFGYLIYKYATAKHNYWKSLGVPYEEPELFFGVLKDNVFLRKHFGEIITEIYRKYDKIPFVGIFKFRDPALLVRDPELIKNILIKDFSYFQKNDVRVSENDIALSKHPFLLSGEKWKTSRTQLLQCFTAAKMRTLVPSMQVVCERLIKYIEDLSKKQGSLESKDLCTRYSVESVVNTSYGLEANCFQEGVSHFMSLSYKIFHPTLMVTLRTMLVLLMPTLGTFFDIRFVSKEVGDYFIDFVTKSVKYRKDNNINRKDFLDILMEMQSKEKEYGLDDIISHAVGLFLDGTETSSNSMAFALYEIAANLHVQTKLHEEIEAVKRKYNGKVTYEAIQDMTYLDCVINEALRLHPPGLELVKVCTQDYTMKTVTEPHKIVKIKAGTSISIPVYALHMDEKYFPDPERFDPERFTDENKASIQKCTYMPFGEGQRMCLGQRFAMLQSKVGIVAILSNFEIRVSKKTKLPLKINPKYFMMLPEGGLWLNFYKRT